MNTELQDKDFFNIDEWFGMLLVCFCFLGLILVFSIVGLILFAVVKLFILR